jgi:hypothetical protein
MKNNNTYPKILCRCCGGAGYVPLSHEMQLTLDAVGDDWRSTTRIAKIMAGNHTPVAQNALVNRLRFLEKKQMVDSWRRGGNVVHWKFSDRLIARREALKS